jgi:PAS domain-containing protein
MRGTANATFEGLLVCEGATIVTVNDNFAALIGCSADSVVGAKLEQYFSGTDISRTFFDHPNQSIEGTLVHFDGSKIPVELIQRSIDFGGKPDFPIGSASTRSWIRRLKRRWRWDGGSPSCASTSIGSRRSTIYADMRRATGRFSPSQNALVECWMKTKCWRDWAAMSLPS